ncbi:hypothetical protein DRJ19_01255 [Candidatus Woesearchaeota archaeon]|nr:MAG: hypothetical protein DRJ19_01255 [Candidatus Woesearchaeota archaeon]
MTYRGNREDFGLHVRFFCGKEKCMGLDSLVNEIVKDFGLNAVGRFEVGNGVVVIVSESHVYCRRVDGLFRIDIYTCSRDFDEEVVQKGFSELNRKGYSVFDQEMFRRKKPDKEVGVAVRISEDDYFAADLNLESDSSERFYNYFLGFGRRGFEEFVYEFNRGVPESATRVFCSRKGIVVLHPWPEYSFASVDVEGGRLITEISKRFNLISREKVKYSA